MPEATVPAPCSPEAEPVQGTNNHSATDERPGQNGYATGGVRPSVMTMTSGSDAAARGVVVGGM